MTALLDFDFAPVADPEIDPAIFAPLPITDVEPFARPRLRLVIDEPGRRGGAPAAPARRAPLRLTRRGRLVAVLGLVLLASLVSALVFALALGPASGRSAAVAPPAGAAAGSTVVVQPGDTLWAIASRVAPKADPRVVVQQIIDRNGLASASVQAGQVLVLPS